MFDNPTRLKTDGLSAEHLRWRRLPWCGRKAGAFYINISSMRQSQNRRAWDASFRLIYRALDA